MRIFIFNIDSLNYGEGTKHKCFAWIQGHCRKRQGEGKKRFVGENNPCGLIAQHVEWEIVGGESCSGAETHFQESF